MPADLGARGLTLRQLPRCRGCVMVDYFALGLTHVLLALGAWRLMQRSDLDADPVTPASGSDGDA